jgi:hypothetical protein
MRIGGGTGGGAMPWWLARRDREFGPGVRGMALSVSADRGLQWKNFFVRCLARIGFG